eukprot:CAMPEP_0198673660 /NCGR_PEP_ID=MMETSP1467-20131203/97519_1 /TAXON_ID=1462469 /ORGANISM="unid. sp., Strain CCMP2135" /LENGTH=170 /DNA_ID=CAMNT_0044410543 /DNA_START=167 /DNA_END=676 /DNA_ORIENTATION=-
MAVTTGCEGGAGANPQKPSQFGSYSATRVREGGIASNRGSACRGEYSFSSAGPDTGAAWLSSARVVDVGLSPATSATLAVSCQQVWLGTLNGTAGVKPEEGGDDVKSSWPLRVGLHTCYNGSDRELIKKNCLSSDCLLQLEGMKLESLVIADQHAAVNTFPGLVHTARHT